MKYEFKECDSCAAKPGSPVLCRGCLHNRAVIEDLSKPQRTATTPQDFKARKLEEIRNFLEQPLYGTPAELDKKFSDLLTQSLTEAMEEGRKLTAEEHHECAAGLADEATEAFQKGKKSGYVLALSDVEREMPEKRSLLADMAYSGDGGGKGYVKFQKTTNLHYGSYNRYRAEMSAILSRLRGEK